MATATSNSPIFLPHCPLMVLTLIRISGTYLGKTTRRGMIAQEMDADISQIDINGDGQINSEDFKIMLNLK